MNRCLRGLVSSLILVSYSSFAATPAPSMISNSSLVPPPIHSSVNGDLVYNSVNEGPYFDLPVTYNSKVKAWIQFYQTNGKKDFKRWLERSSRYLPRITNVLGAKGLPNDLAYLAMIESGFSLKATSAAEAVGPWQFMKPTASRYGLKVDWWIDERKDIIKSTIAAATYLNDLYHMFNSWYLAAAAYNMGEGRVKALVAKYQTRNYWALSKKRDFPPETEQYIPKLIAAMLIAKSPRLYGFRDLSPMSPIAYDEFYAPGGTDLESLSSYLGYDSQVVLTMNPELSRGFIPSFLTSHKIRIPHGTLARAQRYARSRLAMSN
jgi:membrane-bound lytic murein transglycosylase D